MTVGNMRQYWMTRLLPCRKDLCRRSIVQRNGSPAFGYPGRNQRSLPPLAISRGTDELAPAAVGLPWISNSGSSLGFPRAFGLQRSFARQQDARPPRGNPAGASISGGPSLALRGSHGRMAGGIARRDGAWRSCPIIGSTRWAKTATLKAGLRSVAWTTKQRLNAPRTLPMVTRWNFGKALVLSAS
jgi:hypothetical protein